MCIQVTWATYVVERWIVKKLWSSNSFITFWIVDVVCSELQYVRDITRQLQMYCGIYFFGWFWGSTLSLHVIMFKGRLFLLLVLFEGGEESVYCRSKTWCRFLWLCSICESFWLIVTVLKWNIVHQPIHKPIIIVSTIKVLKISLPGFVQVEGSVLPDTTLLLFQLSALTIRANMKKINILELCDT